MNLVRVLPPAAPAVLPAARCRHTGIRTFLYRRETMSQGDRGEPADLSGQRRGRRQDLRHALRGTPPGRAGHRRGRRLRRDARAPAHPRAGRGPGSSPARPDPLPGHHLRGDGHRRGARPQAAGRAGGRARAHQRPRLPQRQALAGRGGTAQRGHRGDHHRQHPAPGVTQRRRGEDHRGTAAGDGARCRGPRRRPGRARGHDAGGAAPPDGARQHLRAGEDRRRAEQLLPGRQPDRAARARPALAGRQGRRGAAAVPGRPPHHRHLGGAGAGGGRAHRRPGGRDADPPGRPDRGPLARR